LALSINTHFAVFGLFGKVLKPLFPWGVGAAGNIIPHLPHKINSQIAQTFTLFCVPDL
jgi:hypothetical protein